MKSSRFSVYWRHVVLPVGVAISLVMNVVWIPGAKADLVPQNRVQVRMEGFNLSGTYSVAGGQPTGVGQFKNGNAGEYPEGSCIPSLISVKNNDNAAGDIQLTPYFDYSKDSSYGITNFEQLTTGLSDPSAQADDLNDFVYPGNDLSTVTSFKTDTGGSNGATISGPYSGQNGTAAPAAGDTFRHYNIFLQNVAKGETVYVLFCAQLHIDASEYGGGAQMSIRTGEGGSENIAIQAMKLLVLPKLTLTKVVEGGTATADEWSFNVSPAINGQSVFPIADGQNSVVIDNIEPNGTYTVTESGPSGYQLKNGSGENCVFSGSTASTTLAAAKPQQTATCIFTNEYVPPVVMPKLTVTKVVVNDNGGAAVVSNFPLFVDGTPVTSGQQNTFATGTRTVSETGSSGYTATFGGDCDSAGQVTLAEGDVKSCTITNDDIYTATTATLTVIKQVVNDNGGTKAPGDFTLNVTGSNPSQSSFAGSSSGVVVTLDAGSYSVDENADSGYAKTLGSDCFGTLAVGESKTCTVTNDDIDPNSGWTATTGTVVIIKQVVNDNGGTKVPGDFTMTVNGTNPSQTSFPGSAAGVSVIMDAGSYAVDENVDSGYAKSLGANCSGTLAAGDTKSCIVTNDDIYTATTATLTVIKLVINDDNGKKEPSDFKLDVSGTSPSPASFDGSSSGTVVVLGAGSYNVTEKGGGNYDASYSADCSGTIAAGESKTCTVTNDDRKPGGGGGGGGGGGFEATTGTLTVIKLVKNDYGGTKLAGDFTLTVSGTSPSLSSFAGSASGTVVVLGAGAYGVDEIEHSAYIKALGSGCTGTIAAGESLTCTVTNTEKPTSPVDTADISVAKTASASTLQTGTSLDYFIDLVNIGPDAATNAQVADVLPTGFIYQSSVASQGFYATTTGVWTVGSMAVNATATLSINVLVTAAAGLYVNTATATALEYDPVSANNVSSHSVTVTAAGGGGGSGGGGGGSGGTGGPVTYIYDPPIGGGGSSPVVSPAVLPPAPVTLPVPLVLGAVDEVLAIEPEAAPPVPRVLGAVDELPRTGAPVWTILAAVAAVAAAMRRKR